jgi:predicted transcriptional regulator
MGQASTQVKAYIINNGINPANIPALIAILKTVFGNPDHIVQVECKLKVLKHTNHNFSTHNAQLQHYTVNV